MKLTVLLANAPMMLFCATVYGSPAKLSAVDEAAAFKSAGYKLKGKQWRACDDPTPSYTLGAVEEVRDVNGDGLPEVVLTEGSTSCYGNTGAGYSLVSKQAKVLLTNNMINFDLIECNSSSRHGSCHSQF